MQRWRRQRERRERRASLPRLKCARQNRWRISRANVQTRPRRRVLTRRTRRHDQSHLGLARLLLVKRPLLIEPVGKTIAANVPALFHHVVVETSERLPLLTAFALSGHGYSVFRFARTKGPTLRLWGRPFELALFWPRARRENLGLISSPLAERRCRSRLQLGKLTPDLREPRRHGLAPSRVQRTRGEQEATLVAERVKARGPFGIVDDLLAAIVIAPNLERIKKTLAGKIRQPNALQLPKGDLQIAL